MSPIRLILLVVLVLVLVGGLGGERWGVPYGYGAGHYGVGGVSVVLVILLIVFLAGWA
jgi:Protein of unknown function (DUF3309)